MSWRAQEPPASGPPVSDFLAQLFRAKTDLPTPIARVIDAWRALPAMAEDDVVVEQSRLVVIDIETAGFDARKARLLSIGATAIEGSRVAPSVGFGAVLHHAPPFVDGVAVHGITPGMQAAGDAPEEVLSAFLSFVGKAPCVAFHASFVQTVLDGALRAELGVRLPNRWLDLAVLASALVPEARLERRGLDDWLNYFGLRPLVRNHPIHDARMIAELCLVLIPRAAARGISTVAALRAVVQSNARIATGVG